jgi:hypothetical protein
VKLILKLAAVLALVTLGMTAAYFAASPVGAAPGGGTCLAGGTKLDFAAESYTISVPGSTVNAVAIKAGPDCFVYTSDSEGPCYVVSGIGTSLVMIERIGSGPTCKGISHVEYTTGPGVPPPTTTTTPTTTTGTTPTTTTTP